MKTIEISDALYGKIVERRSKPEEDIDSILKRIFNVRLRGISEPKKIVFVGEAAVGKSTIRKTFFEYFNPQDLLDNSLEPTRGLEFFQYDLFDLNCSVLDTSGQELRDWIQNQQEEAFSEADYIVFVASAPDFNKIRAEIYNLLQEITLLANFYAQDIIVALFIHKIDLLAQEDLDDFITECREYHRQFEKGEETDIPLFFTSIKSDFLSRLNIAFMKLFRIDSLILPDYKKYLNDF